MDPFGRNAPESRGIVYGDLVSTPTWWFKKLAADYTMAIFIGRLCHFFVGCFHACLIRIDIGDTGRWWLHHQTFQVPKMEVLIYISSMDTAYVREHPPPKYPYKVLSYLHFRYLKCLVITVIIPAGQSPWFSAPLTFETEQVWPLNLQPLEFSGTNFDELWWNQGGLSPTWMSRWKLVKG